MLEFIQEFFFVNPVCVCVCMSVWNQLITGENFLVLTLITGMYVHLRYSSFNCQWSLYRELLNVDALNDLPAINNAEEIGINRLKFNDHKSKWNGNYLLITSAYADSPLFTCLTNLDASLTEFKCAFVFKCFTLSQLILSALPAHFSLGHWIPTFINYSLALLLTIKWPHPRCVRVFSCGVDAGRDSEPWGSVFCWSRIKGNELEMAEMLCCILHAGWPLRWSWPWTRVSMTGRWMCGHLALPA